MVDQPTGSDCPEPGPEYSGSGPILTRKHLRSEQDAKNFIVSSRARRRTVKKELSDDSTLQWAEQNGPSENVRPTL